MMQNLNIGDVVYLRTDLDEKQIKMIVTGIEMTEHSLTYVLTYDHDGRDCFFKITKQRGQ